VTQCQTCAGRAENYLCPDCTDQLGDMLDQLPTLLDELDNRIQQLDRIQHGTIGRNRRPAEMNPIDFDALELARKTRKQLHHWVTTITRNHTGRQPPALNTVTTQNLARWLAKNTNTIACQPCAGQLYRDIAHLTGTPGVANTQRGQLTTAIDRIEKHFAGPCPTIRAYNQHGNPIECGTILYADDGDQTTTCPTCQQTIDVKKNRSKAATDRDLMTEPQILEKLEVLGEKVSRVKLYSWITTGRLKTQGWLDRRRLQITTTRICRGDPKVYSFSQARHLGWKDRS
jgi:hypothetical protein